MSNDEHVYHMGWVIGGCLYYHKTPLSSILNHLHELYYLLCMFPRLGNCSALVFAKVLGKEIAFAPFAGIAPRDGCLSVRLIYFL